MKSTLGNIIELMRTWLASPLVRLYSGNSIWLLASRAAWIVQALTVGIIVTRVLGPSRLGQFNYALSIVGLMTIFMMLQCDDVIVRHIIRAPAMRNVLLGSNFVFKLATFLLSGVTLLGTIFLAPADPVIRNLILIFYLMQLSTLFGGISLTFTAFSQNKYQAYASLFGCIVYSILRLVAAFYNAHLYWYGLIEVLNLISMTFMLYVFYRKEGWKLSEWRFDRRILKCIFKASLPLFLFSLSGTLYAKTDIVMLEHLIGTEAVGYYSLASRCVENITLIIGILIPVFVPVLFNSAKISEALFRIQFHRLYFMMFWLMMAFLILTQIIAWPVIRIFYGVDFLPTVPILRVFVITVLSGALSSVFTLWIIKTSKLFLGGLFNMTGFLLNVPLNYILITALGTVGSAWGTVIAAPLGIILVLIFFQAGRFELKFMLKSIFSLPSFKLSQ